MKVFRSSVTVYFANAELYSDSLKQRCGVDVDYLLSQKKKLLRKQELKLKQLQKENKLPKQAAASKGTSVSINVNPTVMDIESNNDVEGSKARVRLEGAGSFRDEGAQVIPGGSPWTYQLWVQGCHASGRRIVVTLGGLTRRRQGGGFWELLVFCFLVWMYTFLCIFLYVYLGFLFFK